MRIEFLAKAPNMELNDQLKMLLISCFVTYKNDLTVSIKQVFFRNFVCTKLIEKNL